MTQPAKNAPASANNAEIRKHYFLDSYVIIAPKRGLRPDSFSHASEPHKVPNASCHFCHNAEHGLWQTPRGKAWDVKVIPNAFPALTLQNPQAFGTQEIVINTPSHDLEFSELPVEHIQTIFAAYQQRLTALKATDGIRYVLVFKNDGPQAGASVAHAHCQIFGLPLIPPQIQHESDALNHYWDEHKSCAYCDIISWEDAAKVRIIAENKHFTIISPHAAAYAFEAWILPRRHFGQFTDLTADESHSLAVLLKKITAKLDSHGISFNYFLQESLPHQDHHFVIKLEPRTTKWAGAELGTGIIINPVTPEYAALWYRDQAS